MVDDCMLGRVLDKIKEIIGFEKFDDTKILFDTDDKLPGNVISESCYINDMCY